MVRSASKGRTNLLPGWIKNLKIIFLREGRSDLRQLELSGRWLFWGGLMLLIAMPISFYGGAHLLLNTAYKHRVQRLQKDNKALREVVNDFSSRLGALEQDVAYLGVLDQNLRSHANLPQIPDEVREVGIGGSMNDLRTDLNYLLSNDDISLSDISDRLDWLTRGLKLQQLSYEEARDVLKNDLVRLRKTPSVRPINRGTFTSGFGQRWHPYTGDADFHNGQDISVRRGTPVSVTADGKVVVIKNHLNLGLYVKIDHGNGFHTIYGHLDRVIEGLGSGQRVTRGEIIGYSGNSGRSTAPHLHYEVRHYGKPQNPLQYFN